MRQSGSETDRTAEKNLRGLALTVAAGAAACGVMALAATGNLERAAALYPGCPFRLLTGLDCPGCGGTRAVAALGRGDLTAAFDHNLLTITLLPLLAIAWWKNLLHRLGRGSRLQVSPTAGSIIATAVVTFFIARNIPTLSWLASGAS